jgi:hypothetical protein
MPLTLEIKVCLSDLKVAATPYPKGSRARFHIYREMNSENNLNELGSRFFPSGASWCE